MPRRNPDVVVCALLEEGEHGYLAARTAAKVIKAYVDKQRRTPAKMAGTPRGDAEVGAVWTEPDAEGNEMLKGWRFSISAAKPKPRPVLATAAPGMH